MVAALLLPSLLLGWQGWQQPASRVRVASQHRAAQPVAQDAATDSQASITELLTVCAKTDRGQRASSSERSRVAALVSTLEAAAPKAPLLGINGRWRMVYSSEAGPYRSSPFFSAFAQCTRSLRTPLAIPSSSVQQGDAWSAAVYAITDAIPFYDVGAVSQTISGVCDEDDGCVIEGEDDADGPDDGAKSLEAPSDGTSDQASLLAAGSGSLVSEVSVEIGRLFGLPRQSSLMTTTAAIEGASAVGSGVELTLAVQTTAALQSSLISMLPAFGELPTFPSGSAMELVSPGSSRVKYRTTYLSDSMRISRYVAEVGDAGQVDDSAFFVYLRED